MRVIVFAEDLSGRKDDGYYTKSSIASALDIFFDEAVVDVFLDNEGENPLTRVEAEQIFNENQRITFFNEAGERVVISRDPSDKG